MYKFTVQNIFFIRVGRLGKTKFVSQIGGGRSAFVKQYSVCVAFADGRGQEILWKKKCYIIWWYHLNFIH